MFLPHPRVKLSIAGSLREREVACSASDRQGSNPESRVWRTVSSQSSHHPQEVLLAQLSLYVHKGGLKPDSFHFFTHDWYRFSISKFIHFSNTFSRISCRFQPPILLNENTQKTNKLYFNAEIKVKFKIKISEKNNIRSDLFLN